MTYIALLRGINVGGNRKVNMGQLRAALEAAGLQDVSTYINSGNVIFKSNSASKEVTALVEGVIEKTFGFKVDVIVVDKNKLASINQSIPSNWTNDTEMKCDVLFLHKDIDSEVVLEKLKIKSDIDHIIYVPGAIIWSVDRANVTKSGMIKIIGTDIYKKLTIRNCNTTRKLANLTQTLS